MTTGNHIVDNYDAEQWANRRKPKDDTPKIQLPVKDCGCSRYEHCQRCVEILEPKNMDECVEELNKIKDRLRTTQR